MSYATAARLAVLAFLLALFGTLALAAPTLQADSYPLTGVVPDSASFTVNGGAPIACTLADVAGGKQPRCDLASITDAGTYTLVLTVCRSASIANATGSATVTPAGCAPSAPFSLRLASEPVPTPTVRVVP